MHLTAPIYRLKRQARQLSRRDGIPLHAALDHVARAEGFGSWSLLVRRAAEDGPAARIYPRLSGGDMLLLGARPGHGKTLLGLQLAVEATKAGRPAVFYSLEWTEAETRLRLGAQPKSRAGLFRFEGADTIDADFISADLDKAPRNTLVVVDYLQALAHRRETPDLATQMQTFRTLVTRKEITAVLLSQIDRRFDPAVEPVPDLDDVRMSNAFDLGVFDKVCFLNDGALRFRSAR